MKRFLAALMTLSTAVVQSGGVANAYDVIEGCKAAACRYCAELNAGDDFYEDDNERASLLPEDCWGIVDPTDSIYGQRIACDNLIPICETPKKSFWPDWGWLQVAAGGAIASFSFWWFRRMMLEQYNRLMGHIGGQMNGLEAQVTEMRNDVEQRNRQLRVLRDISDWRGRQLAYANQLNGFVAAPAAPVVQQAALTVNDVVEMMHQGLGEVSRDNRWAIGRVQGWIARLNRIPNGTPVYKFIRDNADAIRQDLIHREWIQPNVKHLLPRG